MTGWLAMIAGVAVIAFGVAGCGSGSEEVTVTRTVTVTTTVRTVVTAPGAGGPEGAPLQCPPTCATQ